jgi:hypothetical protein
MFKQKQESRTLKTSQKNVRDKTQELPDVTVATICTDGSGIDQKIGAAAYASTLGEVSLHHLGGETEFNVYIHSRNH